ncbi:MAG: hypothetical protein IPI19_16800 [Ignavibacteriales bacterium]|nr:hypothetical protein [Ignavibacteriales bacterium]
MSAEDLEKEIEKVRLTSYDITEIKINPDDEPKGNGGDGNKGSGNITFVKNLATVEEIVIAINLKFKQKVSPEGAVVVERFLQSLKNEESLKTTIKNNLQNDEKQVYDLIIDKLCTDFILIT